MYKNPITQNFGPLPGPREQPRKKSLPNSPQTKVEQLNSPTQTEQNMTPVSSMSTNKSPLKFSYPEIGNVQTAFEFPKNPSYTIPSIAPMTPAPEIKEETSVISSKNDTRMGDKPNIANKPSKEDVNRGNLLKGMYYNAVVDGDNAETLLRKYPELQEYPDEVKYGVISNIIDYRDKPEVVLQKYPELTGGASPKGNGIEGGTKGALARLGGDWGKLEWLNPLGATAEALDDLVQKIPTVDVTKSREENLENRINNLSEQEIAKYRKDFEALKKEGGRKYNIRRIPEGDTIVGQLRNGIQGNFEDNDEAIFRNYVEEREKSFVDHMLGVGEDGPNVLNMIGNIPGSAMKTASAIARAGTNPLDTFNGLRKLVGTEEGRQILIHRYGTWEGFEEAMENDPVGVASDVLAVAEGGVGLTKFGTKALSKGASAMNMANTSKNLANFSQKAGEFGKIAGGASDLGLRGVKDYGMNKLGMLGKSGNKFIRGGAKYLEATQNPMKAVGTMGKGIQKTANKGLDWLNEEIKGIDKNTIKQAQSNPYVGEYWGKIKTEIEQNGLKAGAEIVQPMLEESSSSLVSQIAHSRASLSGPLYNKIRELKTTIDTKSIDGNIKNVLKKYKIKVDETGKLDFTQSKYSQPSDMNSTQAIYDRIQSNLNQAMDVETILNLRKAVDNAMKREGAPTKNRDILMGMRKVVDDVAKEQISELKKLDAYYSKEIKALNELEEGLVYRQGDRKGKFRDNIQQIMKDLNKPNRAEMRKRLETLMPDLPARIEAINLMPIIGKAYQGTPGLGSKLKSAGLVGVPSLIGSQFGGLGGAIGMGILGYIGDNILKQVRKSRLEKALSEISPEAQSRLAEINHALENNQTLRQSEIQILDGIKKKLEAHSNEQPLPNGPQDKGNLIGGVVRKKREGMPNKSKFSGFSYKDSAKVKKYKNIINDVKRIEKGEVKNPVTDTAKLTDIELPDRKLKKTKNANEKGNLIGGVVKKGKSKLKEKDIVKLGGQHSVVKETPKSKLYEEARKYKSADEFVKAQGEPLYHGSKGEYKDFTTFDKNKIGSNVGSDKEGIFFTNSKDLADRYTFDPMTGKKGGILESYIDFKNPLKIYVDQVPLSYFTPNKSKIFRKVKKGGYDGIIIRSNKWNEDIVVALEPTQIKTKPQLKKIREEANSKGNKTNISPKIQLIDKTERFDIKDIENRRFMFETETKELVLGDEGVLKGNGVKGTHAEEFYDAGAKGNYDNAVRGWIGYGGDYKNGVIHFSPAITKADLSNPKIFNKFYDTIELFKKNGANNKTVIRNGGKMGEQTIGEITKIKQYDLKKSDPVYRIKGDDFPNAKKIGKGEFGDIYEGVKGAEAEQLLIKNKGGEVKGAYSYKGQDVDLMWGEYKDGKGYGLSKIYEKHPEVVGRIQNLLDELPIKELRGDRIILASDKSKLVISLNWKGKDKRWVVTAFDLK